MHVGEEKVKEDVFEDWWVVEHAAQVLQIRTGTHCMFVHAHRAI